MWQMIQIGGCCSIGAAAGSAAACAGTLGGAAFFGIAEAGAGKTVGGSAFAAGIVEEEANNTVSELMGGRHGGGCPSFKPEVPGGGCGCGCVRDEAALLLSCRKGVRIPPGSSVQRRSSWTCERNASMPFGSHSHSSSWVHQSRRRSIHV